MAEYSSNAVQTVNPGESIVFNTTDYACQRGFIKHRPETGAFLLNGWLPNQNSCNCRCTRNRSAEYLVDCGCNVAIPTGGTVGTISIALAVDGVTVPASEMDSTPAAAEQFNNVSRAITVPIWRNCCQTLTIRNISDQPILVRNANVIITRPDLTVTY